MEAKNYRLGNLLYSPISKENVILVAIEQWNKPITLGKKGTSSFSGFDCLQNIPLTEEILLKCGAKKADKNDSFGGFIIYYPNGNGMRIKNNEWSSQHITVKVEFLHQLQNLYFALTNEELEINL